MAGELVKSLTVPNAGASVCLGDNDRVTPIFDSMRRDACDASMEIDIVQLSRVVESVAAM